MMAKYWENRSFSTFGQVHNNISNTNHHLHATYWKKSESLGWMVAVILASINLKEYICPIYSLTFLYLIFWKTNKWSIYFSVIQHRQKGFNIITTTSSRNQAEEQQSPDSPPRSPLSSFEPSSLQPASSSPVTSSTSCICRSTETSGWGGHLQKAQCTSRRRVWGNQCAGKRDSEGCLFYFRRAINMNPLFYNKYTLLCMLNNNIVLTIPSEPCLQLSWAVKRNIFKYLHCSSFRSIDGEI